MRYIISFLILCLSLNCFSQSGTISPTVKWYTLKEALELTKTKPKKLFLDMYTDWCGWCKKMDAGTFSHPAIVQYLNDYFYPVKFNAERTDTIEFNGKTYVNKSPGPRSPHELAVFLLNGKMSYPTVVYLDEKLNLLTAVPGYMTPQQIEPIMIFFAKEIYKSTTYEEFNGYFQKTFYDTASVDSGVVKWLTIMEAQERYKKEPRKIMVDLNTEWCVECKVMSKTTYRNPIIADYINKNYYPVQFNSLSKDTILFNGLTLINEGKEHPFHQFAVSLLNGKMTFPAMVFIANNSELLSVVPGYFSPKNLEPVLSFFNNEIYKTKTWEEYIKTYQSSFIKKQ